MKLREIAKALDLRLLVPETAEGKPDDPRVPVEDSLPDSIRAALETEVTRGYASDLLSDVLANAPRDAVLVTLQVHLNVIAVATHANLRAVIFSCGRIPEPEVIERGVEEGLVLFSSQADTFDLVGKLYALGLRGKGG
ncbi:MAG: serine kinase [Thermoleophilia bacterium]|nr:serine kinase [Thermoleophilia bacterium]